MKTVRTVVVLGQLGFTLITPPVAMGLLGWWLQSRLGLGLWVMVLCLLLGLATSAASALRFYRRLMNRLKSETQTRPVTFYDHD